MFKIYMQNSHVSSDLAGIISLTARLNRVLHDIVFLRQIIQ